MLEVVENYMLLKKEISSLIKRSGYSNDFIADKIGMSQDYFSMKNERGNWTEEEVLKIIKVIQNEELTNFFDSILIKNCFPGNTLSSKEFEKIMES